MQIIITSGLTELVCLICTAGILIAYAICRGIQVLLKHWDTRGQRRCQVISLKILTIVLSHCEIVSSFRLVGCEAPHLT